MIARSCAQFLLEPRGTFEAYLATISFINPLTDYVEGKAANGKSGSRCDNDSFMSQQRLVRRQAVMQQKLFCGPQHRVVSYGNEFTIKWRRGFDWEKRP
jgi:hypothetical protein